MAMNDLLLWMSARHSGSIASFRSKVTELGHTRGRSAPRVVQWNLEKLGHAEFGQASAGTGWRVAPPILAAGDPRRDPTAFLCGARTPALLDRLSSTQIQRRQYSQTGGRTFSNLKLRRLWRWRIVRLGQVSKSSGMLHWPYSRAVRRRRSSSLCPPNSQSEAGRSPAFRRLVWLGSRAPWIRREPPPLAYSGSAPTTKPSTCSSRTDRHLPSSRPQENTAFSRSGTRR